MKGVIMIIDGMADRPLEKLSGRTPLEAASTPNMDRIAESGINGIMDPIKPGVRQGATHRTFQSLDMIPTGFTPEGDPLRPLVLALM